MNRNDFYYRPIFGTVYSIDSQLLKMISLSNSQELCLCSSV